MLLQKKLSGVCGRVSANTRTDTNRQKFPVFDIPVAVMKNGTYKNVLRMLDNPDIL